MMNSNPNMPMTAATIRANAVVCSMTDPHAAATSLTPPDCSLRPAGYCGPRCAAREGTAPYECAKPDARMPPVTATNQTTGYQLTEEQQMLREAVRVLAAEDRKSTRLNSSHV